MNSTNTPAIWTSTEAASKGPMTVTVLGPLDPSEYDIEEVGAMYNIELPDGSMYQAFEEELVFTANGSGTDAGALGEEVAATENGADG